MNEDSPILYQCWKCTESGILSPTIMRTLMLNDLQLNSSLLTYNSKTTGMRIKSMGLVDNMIDIKVPMPDVDDISNIKKKEYIERRMGRKLTFEELVELRTVFSLGQTLQHNKIQKVTKNQKTAQLLHSDYVGFLTTRKEFINFRNIYDNSNLRYDKYNLFNKLDNTRKSYTIPSDIDLLSSKHLTINVAEGVFDIFGLYFNVFERETEGMLYAAVCGSGFTNLIKYFLMKGVIGNVTVNIYSDDNHTPEFYKWMIKELSPWVNEFNLFYNTKKDDFGVPKSDIVIRKRRL